MKAIAAIVLFSLTGCFPPGAFGMPPLATPTPYASGYARSQQPKTINLTIHNDSSAVVGFIATERCIPGGHPNVFLVPRNYWPPVLRPGHFALRRGQSEAMSGPPIWWCLKDNPVYISGYGGAGKYACTITLAYNSKTDSLDFRVYWHGAKARCTASGRGWSGDFHFALKLQPRSD